MPASEDYARNAAGKPSTQHQMGAPRDPAECRQPSLGPARSSGPLGLFARLLPHCPPGTGSVWQDVKVPSSV